MHIYMRNLKKPSTRNVNIPSSSDTCFSITPLKKLPLADFNGVPLCIQVSDPLAVNSLSKGDTSPTRRSLPRANRTDRCCGGLRRSRAPPLPKLPEKIALGWLRRSPALHPSERSCHGKLTIEGGHLPYQTQFTVSKSDWQMLWGTPLK